MTTVALKPLMRLIVSMEKSNQNYQSLINKLNNMNRNTLNANTQKNYNTIRKGINAIKADLKKNNNAYDQRRKEMLLRGKARTNKRRATTVQAYVRGFLERKQQNKARFVPVTGPNGNHVNRSTNYSHEWVPRHRRQTGCGKTQPESHVTGICQQLKE